MTYENYLFISMLKILYEQGEITIDELKDITMHCIGKEKFEKYFKNIMKTLDKNK